MSENYYSVFIQSTLQSLKWTLEQWSLKGSPETLTVAETSICFKKEICSTRIPNPRVILNSLPLSWITFLCSNHKKQSKK